MNKNQNTYFNIRVYGILINANNQLLVSDELIKGNQITKFPGGGLEFGEGTKECIIREFKEETDNTIEVVEHFYTTDFYQQSAFHPNHQIISIYYLVKPIGEFQIQTTSTVFDFGNETNYAQRFRWINCSIVNAQLFTLPIDKVVGDMLAPSKN